jgi:hypothetical protein
MVLCAVFHIHGFGSGFLAEIFETQVGSITGMNWHATSQLCQRKGCISIASVCRSDY